MTALPPRPSKPGDDWYWCEHHQTWHHRHHHPHHRRPHRIEVLVAATDPTTGDIHMSDTATSPIDVPLTPTNITVALGAVSDASGAVLPNDVPDAGSCAFTVSDTTLATLNPPANPGDPTVTGATTGAPGTFTVGVTCTVGGVAVTGTSAPIVAAAGPPASIEVNVTVG